MEPRPQHPAPGQHGLKRVERSTPYFLFPRLSAYPQVSHAIFTRHGGRSHPPYQSLNISCEVGDRPHHVSTNVCVIKETIGARHLLSLKQVHGNRVILADSMDILGELETPSADAVITNIPGLAIMIKQADCQGVILFDKKRFVAAVVHCGWRGNVSNVLGKTVDRMKQEFSCRGKDIAAGIGPCLGPCCAEFVDHKRIFPRKFQEFRIHGAYFDLRALSRRQLVDAGLREEHIETAGICTRCRTDLFYSYRGEGTTGRFGTVAMLT